MGLTDGKMIHVVQGEYAVSDQQDIVITTVLGSCVAACITDPARGIGGMNHFLLPQSSGDAKDNRYAAAAMEILVNALLRRGASKAGMQAKLFGGARMIPNLPDIGARNAEAARSFLRDEGIAVISGDLGGSQARRIRLWPVSGRVQLLLLAQTEPPPREIPIRPKVGHVELF
ncbi:MAG: chemotaxis protein CheD [Paracoccus sp. (in: a-proteobacteria)]